MIAKTRRLSHRTRVALKLVTKLVCVKKYFGNVIQIGSRVLDVRSAKFGLSHAVKIEQKHGAFLCDSWASCLSCIRLLRTGAMSSASFVSARAPSDISCSSVKTIVMKLHDYHVIIVLVDRMYDCTVIVHRPSFITSDMITLYYHVRYRNPSHPGQLTFAFVICYNKD